MGTGRTAQKCPLKWGALLWEVNLIYTDILFCSWHYSGKSENMYCPSRLKRCARGRAEQSTHRKMSLRPLDFEILWVQAATSIISKLLTHTIDISKQSPEHGLTMRLTNHRSSKWSGRNDIFRWVDNSAFGSRTEEKRGRNTRRKSRRIGAL